MQIYWSDRDVISWLAENSDDEHLKKVKQNAEHHAQSLKMEVVSRNVNDERALFDEDDEDEDEVVLGRSEQEKAPETSVQRLRSIAKAQPQFEGLRTTPNGHQIQEIKELMSVPVCLQFNLAKRCRSDLTDRSSLLPISLAVLLLSKVRASSQQLWPITNFLSNSLQRQSAC